MASRQDSRPTAAWIDIPGPNIGGLIHGVEPPTFHARTSRHAVAADITRQKGAHANTEGMDHVVAVVALMLAAQAAAARPDAATSYVVGSLTVPGVSTGLVLKDGQQVTVTATGTMCPWGTAYCVGPDGNASWATTDSWYGGYLLPGAPAWGLVGRVGNWTVGPRRQRTDDAFGDGRGRVRSERRPLSRQYGQFRRVVRVPARLGARRRQPPALRPAADRAERSAASLGKRRPRARPISREPSPHTRPRSSVRATSPSRSRGARCRLAGNPGSGRRCRGCDKRSSATRCTRDSARPPLLRGRPLSSPRKIAQRCARAPRGSCSAISAR